MAAAPASAIMAPLSVFRPLPGKTTCSPVFPNASRSAVFAATPPDKIASHKVTGVETLDGTKLLFEDESWLLFRQSGTEQMLRIYSEATSKTKVNELLDAGVEMQL